MNAPKTGTAAAEQAEVGAHVGDEVELQRGERAVLLGGDRDRPGSGRGRGGPTRSDSERVSVHFTGLPSLRATSERRGSPRGSAAACRRSRRPRRGRSRAACARAGRASTHSMVRSMCGICVADHMVSCSPVGSTTTERGSMNAGISRCWRHVRRDDDRVRVVLRGGDDLVGAWPDVRPPPRSRTGT